MSADHAVRLYQAGLGNADGTLVLTAALITALVFVVVLIAHRRSQKSRSD